MFLSISIFHMVFLSLYLFLYLSVCVVYLYTLFIYLSIWYIKTSSIFYREQKRNTLAIVNPLLDMDFDFAICSDLHLPLKKLN